MASITSINVPMLATSLPYANYVSSIYTAPANDTALSFLAYDPSFYNITGPTPASHLITERSYGVAHEAGIYAPQTNSIYITSNYLSLDNPINITILSLDTLTISDEVRYPGLFFPNGGCPYPSDTAGTSTLLLFCDEGDFDNPSALTLVDPVANTTTQLLTSYRGLPFASLNDAAIHGPTGDIYFTDAPYGFFQNFRPAPTLPFQIYRFRPSTGQVTAISDAAVINNGLDFSPDYRRLYITDTSHAMKNPANNTYPEYYPNRPTIYVYDLSTNATGEVPELQNWRVFAYVDNGYPDGIHTDTQGNVYAGCGDGVHVWNEEGTLLGKIVVPTTPEQAGRGLNSETNNFAFVPGGGMVVFNNRRMWWAGIQAVGRLVDGGEVVDRGC